MLNDELDMLELRLRELYDVTYAFVVVESNQTHTHKPKPYYLLENIERFRPWWKKIVRVQFDDVIPIQPISERGDYRVVEIAQREAILRGLAEAQDTDVVVVSDVDEIISRQTAIRLAEGTNGKIRLSMQMHYYSLNCVVDGGWILPFALPYRKLRENPKHFIRHEIEPNPIFWLNSGWHFSFFGSNDYLRHKLSNYCERRFDNPEFLTDENLDYVKAHGLDFAHRPDAKMQLCKHVPFLPETIKANPKKYEALGWFQNF
jgi:beta-1,4-mannosyl-glycoprotein beta-1,4-N-acetylglucosaminyltransferase